MPDEPEGGDPPCWMHLFFDEDETDSPEARPMQDDATGVDGGPRPAERSLRIGSERAADADHSAEE